ncbi:MAG: hypothetical protein JEY91_19995 [Spirochaetaceae bacterium]|nr:hypothetical protein [Spirochaetaceae bacterium]
MHKKLSFLLILFLFILSGLYADTELWLSAGFEFGNYLLASSEVTDMEKSHTRALGLDISSYFFWNDDDLGLFINTSVQFPQKQIKTIEGIITPENPVLFDLPLQIALVFGPAFRFRFNDILSMRGGIGLNLSRSSGRFNGTSTDSGLNEDFEAVSYNLGMAIDTGLKFDIYKFLYVEVGNLFSFDFSDHTTLDSGVTVYSDWTESFLMIGIKPYLNIGMTLDF